MANLVKSCIIWLRHTCTGSIPYGCRPPGVYAFRTRFVLYHGISPVFVKWQRVTDHQSKTRPTADFSEYCQKNIPGDADKVFLQLLIVGSIPYFHRRINTNICEYETVSLTCLPLGPPAVACFWWSSLPNHAVSSGNHRWLT